VPYQPGKGCQKWDCDNPPDLPGNLVIGRSWEKGDITECKKSDPQNHQHDFVAVHMIEHVGSRGVYKQENQARDEKRCGEPIFYRGQFHAREQVESCKIGFEFLFIEIDVFKQPLKCFFKDFMFFAFTSRTK